MGDTASIRAVVGTAGHVDHGKTTLIAHLTGIDTDRLSEEKRRGISIELGFAWLDLGDDQRLAIIDVPGHERFVRQMIAGAAGIDLVMLVVASDEGVMPQTLEHLDICQLLGVRTGAIVLTKTDLVDEEWLELAAEDVAETVQGTFLEGAPIWHYSAGDEAARSAIASALADMAATARDSGGLAARSEDRPFKLSIDRIFTMRGFGTVVTGTTASGTISVGDSVVALPQGQMGRVRGLQLHGKQVDQIGPGVRAAINIQGVEHDQLHRGAVLARADEALPATSMVDGQVRALHRLNEPIKDRAKVLVHVGTAQVQATLALIGREWLEPGEQSPCQLRFDHPVAVLPGEPFVIRGFKVLERYGKTLGGGTMLAPQKRRHRRSNQQAADLIAALGSGDPGQAIAAWVTFHGESGVPNDGDLGQVLPFERAAIAAAIGRALEDDQLREAGGLLFARSTVSHLSGLARDAVAAFHDAQPARYGMPVPELKTRLRDNLTAELFSLILDDLLASRDTVRRGEVLALEGFEPRLTKAQQKAIDAVLEALEAGGLTPPRVQDLPEELGLKTAEISEALDLLRQSQKVIRVSNDLCFLASKLEALQREVTDYLTAHDSMDTAAFKAMTGASRKWTIPLGEYLDGIRLTIRVGDTRRLREHG